MDESIDLRQFRYFLAVAEEGHFGRAASRLHISQPPLSRQIRQLEDTLGVDLVVREPAGAKLTAAGEAFALEARRTLAQARKAIAAARAQRPQAGTKFVVGYTTVFDRSVLPDFAAITYGLRRRFPELRFSTVGKHSISLVREVRSGRIDAAFIGLHTEASGLQVRTLQREPLIVALSSGNPLAKKRRLAFADLKDEPLFWFERRLNPGYHDHCRACFERAGYRPRLVPEPDDHHMLLGLVAEGQGIALIPASLRRIRRQGVAFRALADDAHGLSAGIAVAYSAANPSPVLPEFLALVDVSASASTAP